MEAKIKYLITSFILVMLAGCDTMEQDADAQLLKINNESAYFIANSNGFIDLSSRVIAPGKIRIEVTGATRKGELKDIGKGLLQYSPFGGSSINDSFRFSVFSESNELIGADTIGIIMNSDTTKLPCAIYAVNDYAYNVSGPITVDVAANDLACSGNLSVAIHQPDPTLAPLQGTAVVVGNKIQYTPGANFTGTDKVVYKVTGSNTSAAPVFGVLYITSATQCVVELNDDALIVNGFLSKNAVANIQVLNNDKLCAAQLTQYSISTTPLYGRAVFSGNQVVYTAPDTIRQYPFKDKFIYQVCVDGVCETANVYVTAGVSEPCVVKAADDLMDISKNDIPLMYFDVLSNDTVCDDLTSFTITTPPKYGNGFVSNDLKTIGYRRDSLNIQEDFLIYKICATGACSSAKVTIKQKP